MTRTDDERAAEEYSTLIARDHNDEVIMTLRNQHRYEAFLAGISHHEKKAQGLVEAADRFVTKVNGVTALWRHGSFQEWPDMDDIYEAQCEFEDALKNYRGKS